MTPSDEFLPVYHFSEVHSIRMNADRSKIFAAISAFDYRESLIIRFLFFLRGLPKSTATGIGGVKKMGFNVLKFQAQDEIVLGLVGQFWKTKGDIQKLEPHEFKSFTHPAFAKATWSFRIIGEHAPYTVETETRIACPDSVTRRKFSRYWLVIRPFSGWIRIEMLKAIRKKCLKP